VNKADARGRHTVRGYVAEYRLAWKASYQPVLNITDTGRRDGIRYFETEEIAECAAWRAKNEAEQSPMTSTGHKTTAAKAAAEKLFIRRNGKVIPIEHRGARA
jgi:hypothetical protein